MLGRNEGLAAVEGIELAAGQARPLDGDHAVHAARAAQHPVADLDVADAFLAAVGEQHVLAVLRPVEERIAQFGAVHPFLVVDDDRLQPEAVDVVAEVAPLLGLDRAIAAN